MTEPTPPIENPPPPTRPKRHLTDVLIIGMMIGSILLNLYAPLWLKPPYLALSSWSYVMLVFAWIPVYAWNRRRAFRQTRTILTIVVGGMMVCFVCAVLGPTLHSIFALGFLDQINCKEIDQAGSRVRYECTRIPFEGDEGSTHLNLEGYDGLPIVWRVE